jgi:hypothetical protein
LTGRGKLPAPRRGFAVRRLDELLPRPAGRDWDVRFVTATLLFYGLMGAAFFLVDWLNATDGDDRAQAEIAGPADDARDQRRTPYMIRLPQLLKERDDASRVPESR